MMNLILWSALNCPITGAIQVSGNAWYYYDMNYYSGVFKQKIIFSLFLLIHAMKQKKESIDIMNWAFL